MPIQPEDVKLFESQRLTDEDDGGGRITGREVVAGAVNNLFPDISRLDRTVGDVALRKAFVGIATDNSDVYLGSHIIVTAPPKDPNVSVLLFNTDDQTDERLAAQNRIESYVVPSIAARWELLGDQLEGQRTIAGYQREEMPVPELGEVFQLTTPEGDYSQFVRISSIETALVNFSYFNGSEFVDFSRRQLIMQISAPLKRTFTGDQAVPGLPDETIASRVNATQIADTARYYGLQPLAEAVKSGDLTLKARSVYAPLIPSAKVENPLLDQEAGGGRSSMVAAANTPRTITLRFVALNANHSRSYTQRGILPGSMSLSIEGGEYSDDGAGALVLQSGSGLYERITVDYALGEINCWRNSGQFSGTASLTYTVAASFLGNIVTASIAITGQNRGFNYTLNMAEAKPRPGTLRVSYIALGKWQEIFDTGTGRLTGAGSGTVYFNTGSAAITLDALPDPQSAIVYSYLTQDDSEITIRTGEVPVDKMEFRHALERGGIQPTSLRVNYLVGGESRELTDSGNGLLYGDGEGNIRYADGELSFRLSAMPDPGSDIEISYKQGENSSGIIEVLDDGTGIITGFIPGAPLLPGSIQLSFTVNQYTPSPRYGYQSTQQAFNVTQTVIRTVADNATGGWQGEAGSIDYQTGEFSIKATRSYTYTERVYSRRWGRVRWDTATLTKQQTFTGSSVNVKAQSNTLLFDPYVETIAPPELTLDLMPLISEEILLPGSVIFEWNGEQYFDRDGTIYKEMSTETNAGEAVGTIDYSGGLVTLARYPQGALKAATILSAASIGSGFQTNYICFRTPGAPIRPGSLQITATRVDTGEIITGAADFNGEIITDAMRGTVDSITGLCEIEFTDGSTDAEGNPPEDGSDAVYVLPQSIRFNAIIETSLPLDAELIGLDPVRLPMDGRVPIYRPGDIAVIRHENLVPIETPTAGQTVTLARAHQAEITVQDSTGARLAAEQFSADRTAGTVQFAQPLSLVAADGSALVPPLAIRERVEHMSVLSDVQITGEMSIIAPVPWDLPAEEATISSAVVYGDLQARVKNFYSQKVWDSGDPNWTDYPIGDGTTAQYNHINYPLTCHNKGSIFGRWALIFSSNTTFVIVEEKLGVIDAGSTGVDTAPINPETGTPYFEIDAAGWGSGWAAGNVVRFNTNGCTAPVWICRTVLSGQGTETDDEFILQIRGDAD